MSWLRSVVKVVYYKIAALEKVTTSGDRQVLMELVTQPSYDLYTMHDGETLLHIASRKGHLNVVKTLIEVFGCQPDITDKFGNSPCHSACAAGQLIIMDYYDKCPYRNNFIPINSSSGDTLLHLACKSGSVPMVRRVFVSLFRENYGFMGHIKISEYQDEVFSALINESSLKMRSKLEHEIFFKTNKTGYTPLHLASSLGHIDVVKFYFYEVRNFFDEDLSEFLPSVMHLAYRADIVKHLPSGFAKNINFLSNPCILPDGYNEKHNFKQMKKSRQVILSEPMVFYAARCGDLDIVKAQINNVLLYSLKNEYADTLLHAACVSGNTELVKFVCVSLKSLSPDIKSAQNSFGNTCLHLACEWGSSELVKYLLKEGFKVNAKNSLGQTPLHLSILHERKEIFEILLKDENTDVHAQTQCGETPLHIAASRYACIGYVKSLSEYYKEYCYDNQGETPLFNACRTGNKEILDHFIKNKIKWDLLAINKRKETIAYIACRLENLDLLDITLCQESYPSQNLNIASQTLLQVACSIPGLKVAKHLVNTCKKYFYKISDDINLIDHFTGLTLIQNAYIKREKDTLDFLFTVPECNPDVRNKDGNTLLHVICHDYDREFSESCIMKCSKTIRNKDGDTPLHVAAKATNKPLLRELLEDLPSLSKLDSYVNKSGKNLLHLIASMDEMHDIIDLIVSKHIIDPLSKNPVTGDIPLHDACYSGKRENAFYLIKLLPEDSISWYNKNGESPLCMAIKYSNPYFDFLDDVIKKCPLPRLKSGFKFSEVPQCIMFSQNESVDIPFCLYLIYYYFIRSNGRPVRVDETIVDAVKIYNSLSDLVDSQGNTLLHYLALILNRDCLDPIIRMVFSDKNINVSSLNNCNSTPLHHACYAGNHTIIMNILNHSRGAESVNKESIHGLPLDIYHDKYSKSSNCYGAVQYLIAHGAQSRKFQDNLFKDSDKSKTPVIRIFFLGNSGVGKTSLVKAIKSKLNGVLEKHSNIHEPTTGLEKTTFDDISCCYEFNDFAGQPEFEVSHSIPLQSILSSALPSSAQNAFFLLLVVRGTDDENTNKNQIDMWIDFLCSHKIDKSISVHVILICSHADLFEDELVKKKRVDALLKYFLNNTKNFSPLEFSNVCICLNCQIIDATPLDILVSYIDSWSIPLQRGCLSKLAASVKLFLKDNYNSHPVKFDQLIKKLKECQNFEIKYGIIEHFGIYPEVIPFVPSRLLECLEELHCNNSITLLKHSKEYSSWWIVSKEMEDVFFKHATSLFLPCHPKYHTITSSTGVASISELDSIFKSWGIEIPDNEFLIDYLVSMEFCVPVDKDTLQHMNINSSEQEICTTDTRHFFFPGSIKKEMGEGLYAKCENIKHYTGWSMKTKSRLSLKFLHSLLLRLPFKFAPIGESNSVYVGRITVWKNGLCWCTDEEIETLIEVRGDNEVVVLCRSYSHDNDTALYSLAKQRCSVVQEIRKIWNDLVQNGAEDMPEATEYVLYPSPDYDSINKCSRIDVGEIIELFKSEPTKRSVYISSKYVHIREILAFDPYIDFRTESITMFQSQDQISEDRLFPKKIHTFLEYLNCEDELYIKSCSILDEFSIFNAKVIAGTMSI